MSMQPFLKNYLDDVRRSSPSSVDLQQVIEEYRPLAEQDSLFHAFLLGEEAFLAQNYEEAVHCYLKAKELHETPFYYYRASAALFHRLGQKKQAQDYIEKALLLWPEDSFCLQLHQQLDHLPSSSVFTPSIAITSPSVEFLLSEQIENEGATELQRYREQGKKRPFIEEGHLQFINGWHPDYSVEDKKRYPALALLSERMVYTPSIGTYLRWNGQGIILNPGRSFTELFHRQGFHLRDVNMLILTVPCSDSYKEIEMLHDLNARLNQTDTHCHSIDYYLVPAAHHALIGSLKPSFKAERQTIHSLDLFFDSPDQESLKIGEGITLHYFRAAADSSKIGIRLDLRSLHNSLVKRSIGMIASSSWTPLLESSLEGCSTLLLGADALGIKGVISLLEALHPQLVLLTAFSTRGGDQRLSFVHALRQTLQEKGNSPLIIPGDTGFSLNLLSDTICSNGKKTESFSPSPLRTTTLVSAT